MINIMKKKFKLYKIERICLQTLRHIKKTQVEAEVVQVEGFTMVLSQLVSLSEQPFCLEKMFFYGPNHIFKLNLLFPLLV